MYSENIFIDRLGNCAVCRERFHTIWPLFLSDNNANMNSNSVQRAAIQLIRPCSVSLARMNPQIQQPADVARPSIRIIVMPDPRPSAAPSHRISQQRSNDQLRANGQRRRETTAVRPTSNDRPRNVLPNRPRRRQFRERHENRYVRPLERVRARQRFSPFTYNLLRCFVCRRAFHTNELPAMDTHEIICSINCFNQM